MPSIRRAGVFVALAALLLASSACFAAPLVFSITTTSTDIGFNFPMGTEKPTVSISVDWGDSSAPQTFTDALFTTDAYNKVYYYVSHNYAAAGNYTVTVSPIGAGPVFLSAFGWGNSSMAYSSYIDNFNVLSWGDLGITSLRGLLRAYWGNTFSLPANIPTTVTDVGYMFQKAYPTDYPAGISSWDVSRVTNMEYMFSSTKFNLPLGSWNVGKVTNMRRMFDASKFNQPIGSWDVSKVQTMSHMFDSSPFNQPIGSWNTGSVTDMSYMFWTATDFNQPLGAWNVANVNDTSFMFSWAVNFNQPLGSWNVYQAKNMEGMFRSARAFSQDLSTWCSSLPSAPTDFAWNTGVTAAQMPKWGCVPPPVAAGVATGDASAISAARALAGTAFVLVLSLLL